MMDNYEYLKNQIDLYGADKKSLTVICEKIYDALQNGDLTHAESRDLIAQLKVCAGSLVFEKTDMPPVAIFIDSLYVSYGVTFLQLYLLLRGYDSIILSLNEQEICGHADKVLPVAIISIRMLHHVEEAVALKEIFKEYGMMVMCGGSSVIYESSIKEKLDFCIFPSSFKNVADNLDKEIKQWAIN